MNQKVALLNAMKLVYEWEMGGEGGEETFHQLLEEKPKLEPLAPEENSTEEETPAEETEKPMDPGEAYMYEIVKGVQDEAESIDKRIEGYLRRWTIDRLSRVDLAILRVATWELTHGVAPASAINTAVEMAKNYSDERAGAFVNGVLGNMARDMAKE